MSDGQLLARFVRCRDELAEPAFTALVQRHGPMVLRVCRQVVGDGHAAEDAFQATFLVLARRAGAIRQPELLESWLYGVAVRTARATRLADDRRRRHELAGGAELVDALPDAGDWPERAVARREELEVLHEEVLRLPQRYRTAVVLCELEGLNYREAALRMQCPVGTVGVRLRRARERLRVRLSHRGVAPSAAILGALAGAEAASALMPAALVGATAEAAAAHAGAGAGLAAGTIAGLAAAGLKSLALAQFKTVIRALLAAGAGAALGWFAVQHAAWRPAEAPRVAPATFIDPASATAAGTTHNRGGISRGPATATARTAGRSTGSAPVPGVALMMFSQVPGAAPDPADEVIGPGRNVPVRVQAAVERVRRIVPVPRHVREERARGEALFAKQWVPGDRSSHGGDGLGPMYNETSCVACHGQASPGGGGPASQNVVILTAVPTGRRLPDGLDRIHPAFRNGPSIVLHRFGTHLDYSAWREQFRDPRPAIVTEPAPPPAEETVEQRIQRIQGEALQGDRAHVRPRVVELGSRGALRMTLTQRNSPALFGAGQIDAIPSEVLVAAVASQPHRVQGRPGHTSRGAIGRFGWKAQVASLHEFVRAACASELGLEVPGHAQAISPVDPSAEAPGVDMTREECDALVAYVRGLPAPRELVPSDPTASREIAEGREHFDRIGCAECHRPSLGQVQGIYSDLLLHRMGTDLSDPGSGYGHEGRPLPDGPSPGEWRTPPLWGFRDSAPYLHDGRARNLEQAVAFHGGQGAASASKFFALSAPDRAKVEAFLNALVAPARMGMPLVDSPELDSVTRAEAEAATEAEVLVRHRRQGAVDREERQAQAAARRKRDEAATKRARVELPIAYKLDTLGKTRGALAFYQQIVRIAPYSDEAQRAADRIVELTGGRESP
jgi:RNA polymerase sigma factor (sigma-70 family)